jgi:hypothetical protein
MIEHITRTNTRTEMNTTKPAALNVTAANGIEFRIVYLADGQSVNRPAANKYNTKGLPLVEVYDVRYPHTPDGQFIADYFRDTFMEGEAGIDLAGGVADWKLDAGTMATVRDWLRSLIGDAV